MLTDRQEEILRVILDYQADHGYAPTLREIGKLTDISSPNGVMCHLTALEKKGYLSRGGSNGATARSLVVKKLPARHRPRVTRLGDAVIVHLGKHSVSLTEPEARELAERLGAEVAILAQGAVL